MKSSLSEFSLSGSSLSELVVLAKPPLISAIAILSSWQAIGLHSVCLDFTRLTLLVFECRIDRRSAEAAHFCSGFLEQKEAVLMNGASTSL